VVAEQLWQKQIECFLPLRQVISKWKDRKKKVQFPLFPGYFFVHVSIQERLLASDLWSFVSGQLSLSPKFCRKVRYCAA